MKDVAIQEKQTSELIKVVNTEKEKASVEQEIALEEEKKTNAIASEANAAAENAEIEFKKAKPILEAAVIAVKELNDNDITVMKNFTNPPAGAKFVGKAIFFLLEKSKMDPYSNKDEKKNWNLVKKMMGNTRQFKERLQQFSMNQAKNISEKKLPMCKRLLEDPDFKPEKVKNASEAAAGLCKWFINTIKFYHAFQIVDPLEREKNDALEKLKNAEEKLALVQAKVAQVEAQVAELQTQLDAAKAEEAKVIAKSNMFKKKKEIATNLVDGLASNKSRWILKESSLNV